MTTESTEDNEDLLLDENLIYILNRLKDLYKKENHNTFNCKTRSSFIYLIRLFRIACTERGRLIIKLAIFLNKTKRWNIYRCLAEANNYCKFEIKVKKRVMNSFHYLVDASCGMIGNLGRRLKGNSKTLDLLMVSGIAFNLRRNFKLKDEFLKVLLDSTNNGMEMCIANYYKTRVNSNAYSVVIKRNNRLLLLQSEFKILGEFMHKFIYFGYTENHENDLLKFSKLSQEFKKFIESIEQIN